MTVSIAQGAPGIVADILAEAGRAMSVREIAAEMDRLGYQHARPNTMAAAWSALTKRRRNHRDVVRVGKGMWERIRGENHVCSG